MNKRIKKKKLKQRIANQLKINNLYNKTNVNAMYKIYTIVNNVTKEMTYTFPLTFTWSDMI